MEYLFFGTLVDIAVKKEWPEDYLNYETIGLSLPFGIFMKKRHPE